MALNTAVPWLLAVNPAAGRVRTGDPGADLPRSLRVADGGSVRRLASPTLVASRQPGDIGAAVRGHPEAQVVAVVGGDGTVAEAVNAMDLERQRLLIVPRGTGNGLARDLGLLGGDQRAGWVSATWTVQWVDLAEAVITRVGAGPQDGRAGGGWAGDDSGTCTYQSRRLMVSTCGWGYAAAVAAWGAALRPLGSWAYPAASLPLAFRMSAQHATLMRDGDVVETRLTNLLVNVTQHAGSFRVFPQSGTTPAYGSAPGLRWLAARSGPMDQLRHNLAVLSERYGHTSGESGVADRISARFRTAARVMLDGEIETSVVGLDLTFRPHALAVLVPA